MKLSERTFEQDGKLIVQQTHDFSPVLEAAQTLRQAGKTDMGESKLVGLVPMKMWAMWAKEAGLRLDDPAMADVVKRKMLDSDFGGLRVWEGRY